MPPYKELRKALMALKTTRNAPEPSEQIIHSERDVGMSANTSPFGFTICTHCSALAAPRAIQIDAPW
jgi:hypothetical protein